ncbi:hypothetical protein Cabys_3482 [Caldithrix abyssi DSM 13497]|uniref:Uncharacterized protein n=1 Tax=Caldithrix abyssi DSM 13497 TaxID=880073 RepID=A0A1J1CCX1_CALAY|nr:hypothetical protein Cabys_3482 [Caldithrix abyssi DSM 13497]
MSMVPATSKNDAIPEKPIAHQGNLWPPKKYSSMFFEARF